MQHLLYFKLCSGNPLQSRAKCLKSFGRAGTTHGHATVIVILILPFHSQQAIVDGVYGKISKSTFDIGLSQVSNCSYNFNVVDGIPYGCIAHPAVFKRYAIINRRPLGKGQVMD